MITEIVLLADPSSVGTTLMMFQIFNIVILLGSIALAVYIAVLLIKFLKKGTRAFEIYIEDNENHDD